MLKREREMFEDINLNPDLLLQCESEIEEYCKVQLDKSVEYDAIGKDPMGMVYVCLEDAFINNEEVRIWCFKS